MQRPGPPKPDQSGAAVRLRAPTFTLPLSPAQASRAQSLPFMLREVQRRRHGAGTQHRNMRGVFTMIYPNKTLYDVKDPGVGHMSVSWFTPCGRFLLGFRRAAEVQKLVVHKFMPSHNLNKAARWSEFFTLHVEKDMCEFPHVLCTECGVFAASLPYVILASSKRCQEDEDSDPPPTRADELTGLVKVEDITFYVFNYVTGDIQDTVTFPRDHIAIGGNLGLSLRDDRLAILSLKYQQLHLFQLRPSGKLVKLMEIGDYCFADDEYFLSQTAYPSPPSAAGQGEEDPAQPKILSCFKQKLLSYFYRRAAQDYESLAMWKMQLLDERRMLILMGHDELLARFRNECRPLQRLIDIADQLAFFVFYDFIDGKVLGIFENNSKDLLDHYLDNALEFSGFLQGHRTAADSFWYREKMCSFIKVLRTSKNGGTSSSIRRTISSLIPMAGAQNVQSPYLDWDLFSYADSSAARSRSAGAALMKFYSRNRQRLAFVINPRRTPNEDDHPSNSKCKSFFCFHPTLPFIITVQLMMLPTQVTNINLHYYDA